MATAIAYTSASPHTLTIRLTGDNTADTQTSTQVLAACAAGPLKEALTRITNWTVFNLGGALCKAIHVREFINRTSGAEPTTAEFFWTATGIKFNCANARIQQREIRLAHTIRA